MKIYIQRLWFDFTHPAEWHLPYILRRTIHKLKDYDRLEYDYSCVLNHATCGRMSNTNYDKQAICATISDTQAELHFGIVKSDIVEMIEKGGAIDDIREYVNSL